MEEKEYKVLFVCLGNICRSPAAEGIFKKLVKDNNLENSIQVDSAGTSGWHDRELPDHRMRKHGARRGYTFDTLSRKFIADDFERFDIILAMDDSNYDNILSLAPDLESGRKVYRMAGFLKRLQHDHIPDPYYMGAEGFEQVLDLLEDACENLLTKLRNNEL